MEMDNSFSPNEIFVSEKKVRITQRFTKFVAVSFVFVIGVIIIAAVLNSSASYVFAKLDLNDILSLFGGLLGIWALLALGTLPFDWNMVILSSDGIKFCRLTKRTFFKWQDIQSCSLRYIKRHDTDHEGTASMYSIRTITIKVTPFEGEAQSMSVTFQPKLCFVLRDEKEEAKFREYLQSIVEGFIIEHERKQGVFNYHWVIRG